MFPHPIFTIDDAMSDGAVSLWAGPVEGPQMLGIGRGSIGVEGDTLGSGSFGCFLANENGRQYAPISSHVLENGNINLQILTSPSVSPTLPDSHPFSPRKRDLGTVMPANEPTAVAFPTFPRIRINASILDTQWYKDLVFKFKLLVNRISDHPSNDSQPSPNRQLEHR